MSERSAVQNPMLRYAEAIGWQYLTPEQSLALRGGEANNYLTDVLRSQLLKLNPHVNDERAAEIIRQLTLLKPTIEGNQLALSWLRGEQSVFVPEENRQRNVRLIDFENLANNIFHVTDEWTQQSTVFRNRADVVYLINGIPVALAETKAAGKSDGLEEGVTQIRRYHRETPEMVTSAQVFEVTHLIGFYYGGTWSLNRKNLFNWKDEVEGDYERKVKAFFDRPRFLQVLRDYIIFLSKDDTLSKVILRQHQTRAVEKVITRFHEPEKRYGLIWHTQGSGKTLTMITIAANLLRGMEFSLQAASDSDEEKTKLKLELHAEKNKLLELHAEKPTVLMLVDRNELEDNLFKDIVGAGIKTVEVAQSKKDLQHILRTDYRGLVVSMIHKFDDIPANLNDRKSIVVLVDEAHRTTGGDLGSYLMAALPNATYIGFTGTPVDNLSKGKGTFKVFGGEDEKGYLDKYSIAESIADGTTKRLHYALAPSELLVDRETLEKQFLQVAEAEGVSDVEELNAILDRAVELKELMKSPERIDKIAAAVARHYRENVEPMGFKAFLVGVDREACAMYKKALDKYLPAEYSRVVYSGAHNDSADLKAFHLKEDDEKALRKTFIKKNTQPKILIVTEKLLTGFDAPILYCMYLDKPMRDHVLLQAIARVNRPYEDDDGLVKPCGFVLDFVGIFEKLESALAFDSDVVSSVIQNIDVLKKLFETMMQETAQKYLPLTKGFDDKAKERAITFFQEKADREDFYKFFRQLQNLHEIISPDAFMRPFIEDFEKLAELYGLIRNAYSTRPYIDKELTEKTKQLLRERTALAHIEMPSAIHELGEKELEALKQSDVADTTKILNLRKVLAVTVDEQGASNPFLLSIGERAEAMAELYEDRKTSTEAALAEFEKLAREAVEGENLRKNLGLDKNTFAVYTKLREFAPNLTATQATEINSIFAGFADYRWNKQQEQQLRAELYKVIRPLVGAKMVQAANALLKIQRV
ncbi:MAG: HsdR family type I site-specific deoxyribonuclease [Acidobacteria bacterium]|nr:HsdR family type I site-specific deoxyribonuclease [Acidobacteriota bacterium]